MLSYQPTALQRRFLELIAERGYSSNAHVFLAWSLKGALCVERLQEAIRIAFTQHDSLLSYFPGEGTEYLKAAVSPDSALLTPLVLRDAWSDTALSQWRAKPFDLRRGPLFRVALAAERTSEIFLAFTFHHLVIDADSIPILARTLTHAYQRLPEASEPSAATYRMFAYSQLRVLTSSKGRRALWYWVSALRNLPSSQPLPFEARATTPPCHAQNLPSGSPPLSPCSTQQLARYAAVLGLTPFMLCLSLFFYVLMQTTGMQDHTVLVPIASRPATPIFRNTIGLFVNLLPIRVAGLGPPTFDHVRRALVTSFLKSLQYRFTPYSEICRHAVDGEPDSFSPLRRILVRYSSAGSPAHGLILPGTRVEFVAGNFPTGSPYDLELLIHIGTHSVELRFLSNGRLSAGTLKEIKRCYAAAFTKVVTQA